MGARAINYIGTSLRGCVRDIVDLNHPIERVDRIVSQTEFATRDEVIEYVSAGKISQKERMAEVAGKLWDSGKIFQPKIDGDAEISADAKTLWVAVAPKPRAAPAPRKTANADLF